MIGHRYFLAFSYGSKDRDDNAYSDRRDTTIQKPVGWHKNIF